MASGNHPCQVCGGDASIRIDFRPKKYPALEVSAFLCAPCEALQARSRQSGPRLKRRGFEWSGCWLRRDDDHGEQSDSLDHLDATYSPAARRSISANQERVLNIRKSPPVGGGK